MRMLGAPILMSLPLMLGGCEGYETLDVEADIPSLGADGKVVGKWKMKKGLFTSGMTSRGTGGACLIEAATDFGANEKCPGGNALAECKTPAIDGVDTSKWHPYCSPEKTCWFKTGNHCNRTPDYIPNGPRRWEKGTYPASIQPVDATQAFRPAVQNWRVVACLNGYAGNGMDSGHCGVVPPGVPPKKIERWSRVAVIRRP